MPTKPFAVVELRQYTLHPGRRDELIELFERAFIAPQEALGIELPGLFRDAERPDRFTWVRAFADMPSRAVALRAFYGGDDWLRNRDRANATMIDSDNVMLLRPLRGALPASIDGPLFCLTYLLPDDAALHAFAARFAEIEASFHREGARVVATLVTEPAVNNFPQLPVREGERAFVAFVDRAQRESLVATGPSEIAELVPTAHSNLGARLKGKRGDFALLAGMWNVRHRRLETRLKNCTHWESYEGTAQGYSLNDGLLSIDEIVTGPSSKGCSVRNLDLARGRWTINWANSRGDAMTNPVCGGFEGARGEFYGTETVDGATAVVRYIWSGCDGPAPQWEQAFSPDGGATWETNWVMNFSRP